MERSMSFGERHRDLTGDDYDLEAQLATMERRYAEARARARQALEECHALEAEQDASAELVAKARERHKVAEAKCTKLRRQIDELEERLG